MTSIATPLASPPCLRVFGFALELRRSHVATFERACREQGDVVRLVVGPPGIRFELYLVFHPDGVRHVLAGRRGAFSKRSRVYREVTASFGRGLLTSDGDVWRRQRRLIQPLFTRNRVAGWSDLMVEEASAFADRLGAGPVTVDVNREAIQLPLRVVGRALFGDDGERAQDVVRWAFPLVGAHTVRRATSPVARPAWWPNPRRVRAAQAALYAEVDELIARRQAVGSSGNDLLSRLLAARDGETGESMSAQQVRDQALIFLLAGYETTATALTFTLHLLGRHPDEQENVHAELDSVLGGRPPTAADAARLQRTEMVVKEAMRLYPPAYGTARRAETDDEICGYRIPRGANVTLSAWITHRHPEFWDHPERFDPERFTPQHESERHPYAYFPFGRGPHRCIGSSFSMLDLLTALAVLVQRFRIRSLSEHVPIDTTGITLRADGPVLLDLERR